MKAELKPDGRIVLCAENRFERMVLATFFTSMVRTSEYEGYSGELTLDLYEAKSDEDKAESGEFVALDNLYCDDEIDLNVQTMTARKLYAGQTTMPNSIKAVYASNYARAGDKIVYNTEQGRAYWVNNGDDRRKPDVYTADEEIKSGDYVQIDPVTRKIILAKCGKK